jgi:hypothetical protein
LDLVLFISPFIAHRFVSILSCRQSLAAIEYSNLI